MKKSNNIISDWLNKYGDPKIDKKVELEIEHINIKLKPKVSFDFDATLSRSAIQIYARELVRKGFDVWIVTSRYQEYDNYDLIEVARWCEIKLTNIHFTNGKLKWEYLKDKDFIFHLDDDWIELNYIRDRTNVQQVNSFGNFDWKEDCEKAIKGQLEEKEIVEDNPPCDFDHNGECLICDCDVIDCAWVRWKTQDYKWESKEELDKIFNKENKNTKN
jgi:hypothetical protein